MNTPQQSESKESLRMTFNSSGDLIEKAITASKLWKQYAMTFFEIDSFLNQYQGWCGRHMWMSRLSNEIQHALRKRKIAKTVAELLSYLPAEMQNGMMEKIGRQSTINLKRTNGVRQFVTDHVPDYAILVERQNAASRAVVMSGRAVDALEAINGKHVPVKIALSDVPWHIRSIAELIAMIEGMPIEDIGYHSLTAAEIAELRRAAADISIVTLRVAEKLREAWKIKLGESVPGLIKLD